jgi:FkbM family methyltransferase
MTPYVLREQNDWFEDEIKFIRSYIKPGMKVLDIGANYGLYTLTIARGIGDSGRIWAFEPAATTADCLRQSIRNNNFSNIELIQVGLSNQIGRAKFYTVPNSELNSLTKQAHAGNQYETVMLLTLDHCAKKYGWEDIDFIKLDAEGEESNILKKGKTFLNSKSPLIMFELKHGDKVNIHLINQFINFGYESYRLVPGLEVLTPFRPDEPYDGYLLNLFCCKGDRAELLESAGVMARQLHYGEVEPDARAVHDYLSRRPFGKALAAALAGGGEPSEEYLRILTAYVVAHSGAIPAAKKVAHLMAALHGLRRMLAGGEQGFERLTTFARIAFDAGERSLGVTILTQLINEYGGNLDFAIAEPVLPASPKYDAIPPNDRLTEWLFASILEQYCVKHAYSSYFTGRRSLPQLEMLDRLGFMDDEMRRRAQMIKTFFVEP